ncbi:MAG: dihydrolipoamide acetyltransferase family protein [Steroidobacteraceae bacterium]
MSRYVFKLPDLGEGTVESEIGAWLVQPGDRIAEEQPMVEMMTDKAAVEVPAPVSGVVVSLAGKPGDRIAVGAELVVIDTAAGAATSAVAGVPAAAVAVAVAAAERAPAALAIGSTRQPDIRPTAPGGRVLTSPAVRRRAQEAGVDLARVSGSGPAGRILQGDLAGAVAAKAGTAVRAPATGTPAAGAPPPTGSTQEIPVIGVRRVIAERMSAAVREIPHFAYVEEVDVTELESLRAHLNGRRAAGEPALTYLPFIVAALARVLREFPQCNAHYDAARQLIVRHAALHVGVATQTPDGLKVPVVRDAQALALPELAAALRRAAERARSGQATRAELGGSTITITSLGRLGGIASTPIINAPEVAIIGVNKAVERPVVRAGAIVPRLVMNLSSSFDHRFVDGHDAAAMIQALKERLEHPATIFM